MTQELIHHKLVSEITAYDRRQSTKRGYNVNALALMLGAAQRVDEAITAGTSPREAVVSNFCGPFMDRCLKAIGETPSTRQDQMMKW